MKIDMEVISIEVSGDQLSVQMRGLEKEISSLWNRKELATVRISDNKQYRRAFYVGRRVLLTVQPK